MRSVAVLHILLRHLAKSQQRICEYSSLFSVELEKRMGAYASFKWHQKKRFQYLFYYSKNIGDPDERSLVHLIQLGIEVVMPRSLCVL